MTKAFVLVHDSIKTDVAEALYYDTGETVQVLCADPITEEILDDEGNPTGEVRFVGWSDTYPCDRALIVGGFTSVGLFPKQDGSLTNWHMALISSKGSILQGVGDDNPLKVIGLAVIQTGDGRMGLKDHLSEENLARMNLWLGNNDYDEIPEDWDIEQIVDWLINTIQPGYDLDHWLYDLAEI